MAHFRCRGREFFRLIRISTFGPLPTADRRPGAGRLFLLRSGREPASGFRPVGASDFTILVVGPVWSFDLTGMLDLRVRSTVQECSVPTPLIPILARNARVGQPQCAMLTKGRPARPINSATAHAFAYSGIGEIWNKSAIAIFSMILISGR